MKLNSLPKALIFCFFLTCYHLTAQTFSRIENYAGFSEIRENNGVAVADYDGDNDLDIFIVAKSKEIEGMPHSISKLFRNNNNGSFTDVTVESGLVDLFLASEESEFSPALDGAKYGVSWGDYDNDGYPDIFFTHQYKVQLFHNNGDGTFQEVTNSSGITQYNYCWNTHATWFDFNNDGFLDLYISDWLECDYNTFYLNNGNGTFSDRSDLFSSAETNIRSYLAFPFDFNNDGWMDLYVANDFHYPNELFINQNGVGSEDQAIAYGADSQGDDMGIAFGDYDNDGDFDMYITDINSNVFLQNQSDNTFVEIANETVLEDVGWAWDTVFADFDLDTDEDLFVVNGFNLTGPQTNAYFQNKLVEGDGWFEEESITSNLGEDAVSVGSTVFDFDNDGDLDLFVTNNDTNSFFYENKTINYNESSDLNWFKIVLEGTTSNRDAIGTLVTINTSENSFRRYYTGLGFLSQSKVPVHFGLADITEIESVEIKWPSGLIETHSDFNSNTTAKFTEGAGFQILNIQPSQKIEGCTNPNSCNYNANATIDDGSCGFLSGGVVEGPTQSGFNQIETYSYNISANSTAEWHVDGGEILSGHGTSQVTVKWGLEQFGKLTVVEIGNQCQSTEIVKNVGLNVNNVPENVSVARIWNEALLEAIRNDYARPNVHARNLFHTAIALYDAWAIYDENARPYLIGNEVQGFTSSLQEFTPIESKEESQKKAMSYAVYTVLKHRFQSSPGADKSLNRFNFIMNQLGYDPNYSNENYIHGSAADLGIYIGNTIINYGFSDGSNELFDYDYTYYEPVNPPMELTSSVNESGVVDPNRWQPLTFNTFVDQSGNLIVGSTPKFLGPEWGNVKGFALKEEDKTSHQRDGDTYHVYHDPGKPPYLNTSSHSDDSDLYKWNFSLVSIWSSHLDSDDGVMWDISPKTIGNIPFESFPQTFEEQQQFYDDFNGGDTSLGHAVNPVTGAAYETQLVPRADYARVLAEFWADGPDSETPPGHWFTILNYVSDHPQLVKKFNGVGEELSHLEWDIKSYFIMAAAMHDAAISAWGIKGYYDYIRPISAIRYMAELGQSSDENLPSYHVGGIPLQPGFVELIDENDALSGSNNEHVGKIKLYAWRGHDYIFNPTIDKAGVGWILAEDWWPYQRPSFVTPPFAGYVSGHSTYSRAAAEVMTLITGDAFFPGGMGEFIARKNEFLVFEKGPSVDLTLQWATYRDASDQTSLSRIWGGIHPPADDVPGRIIGDKVGKDAYAFAVPYFSGNIQLPNDAVTQVFPNPVSDDVLYLSNTSAEEQVYLYDTLGNVIPLDTEYNQDSKVTTIQLPKGIATGIYILQSNKISSQIIIQ